MVEDEDNKEEKIRKERRILDREPKIIPGMEEKKEKKRKEEKIGLIEEELKPKRERKPPTGEIDYGWCDEEELPTIETTFDEDEEIISERTNRKVIR